MKVEREVTGWVQFREIGVGEVYEDSAGDLWMRVAGGAIEWGKCWAVRLRDGQVDTRSDAEGALPRPHVRLVVEVSGT